jgi:hypothetical protein
MALASSRLLELDAVVEGLLTTHELGLCRAHKGVNWTPELPKLLVRYSGFAVINARFG